ncbi:MAG: lipocalin-like domain-containing protein [Oscillochloridaceae bacterium]|nr:carotenoid 1,2-hydratase [Chloroflexaceae bacterium]MDW8391016.1 lipocalin-like domain-containing protein [Oscillochloridaceae bacterium]
MLLRWLGWFAATMLLAACAAPARPEIRARIDAAATLSSGDAGFARALAPRPFVFPRDHGPHPEYQIEWWYYTGNLSAGERRFGYQLTFFRSELTPRPVARESAWGATSVYMAHLALSDVARGRFYAYERFSRGAAGLAGASGEPFRVFLEDWSADGSGPEGMTMRLRAAEGEVALDLTLESLKPPALQGDQGLSQKGPTPGNASYYYSLTRMATTGTIRVGDQTHAVNGLSWMDHEWGTSALEAGAVGWDWFSLQLDDGYDLMYAQVRTPAAVSYSFGSLVDPAGRTTPLDPAGVQLEVLATWRSPASQALYPARWRLSIPALDMRLELEPRLANQELPVSVVYWEGAVRIQGSRQGRPVTGSGYVELTGYATEQGGRF